MKANARVLVLGTLQALAFWWSWRQYSRLPEVAETHSRFGEESQAESLTIVIPARNEAERIGPLLESIQSLSYPSLDTVVVDDASTDETAALSIAAGCRVLRLDAMPAGWRGKNWACWNGAVQSSGDWILFVDADVSLLPMAAEEAIGRATAERVGLLSVFLQQSCVSFWERLLLPFAYCLYFAGRREAAINARPQSALANGQFMLARRSDYLNVGGHEAIRDSVVDDVALAQRFRHCGVTVFLARGEQLGYVRMYRSLDELRAGFAKNAVQFAEADLLGGSRTIGATMVCLAMAVGLVRGPKRLTAAALVAVSSALVSPWYKAFGVPRWYAVLHPLAALAFQGIALEAVVRTATRRNVWSGRRLT